MSKGVDPRFKEINLKRHNSMILNVVDKNTTKKPLPLGVKCTSRANRAKLGQIEETSVKKIKSLSPRDKENKNGPRSKEKTLLFTSFTNKNTGANNSQERESSSEREICEFVKIIKKKVERADKKYGYSSGSSRIGEFLKIFDEFSEFFHEFKFFLNKFKRLFEQVYLKNILLMNELEEFKENLRKNQEGLDRDENDVDEGTKVNFEMNVNKIPVFAKKNSNFAGIKGKFQHENFDLSKVQEKSKTVTDAKGFLGKSTSNGRIPKLSLNENTLHVQGFQDEFMQNIDNFSNSWRKMINDQKRFE